ncbi:MAG: DUF4190 domain-containing protein [Defluviitaleaceae bacterium]|nr:DUF4190 domain-containing protein [Defluviitaleaceae bacterium]MCL2263675.1 DUF4190 domain-containing protein [Defluviitaleaceae bacterium]
MNENQYNHSPQPPAEGGNPPGHGMAITSMIMGILSLVFWCLCIGYIIFAPLAIIFAVVAKKQGSTSGMATAGLATAIVSIVGGVLYWGFVLIVGVAETPWMDLMDMSF